MSIKIPRGIVLILISGLLFQSCSIFGTDSFEDIRYDQTGALWWTGAPEVDGGGMLFETEDKLYDAPGTKEDYTDYFSENENKVQVTAHIVITGDSTARGWGTKYLEIKFLELHRIE